MGTHVSYEIDKEQHINFFYNMNDEKMFEMKRNKC